MYLVQILLPLTDNAGVPLPRDHFTSIRRELTERFGGLTAYTRAPVEGFWKPDENEPANRDNLIIYEVMVPAVDPGWWAAYRRELERRFRQDYVVIRAEPIQLL